MSAMAVGRLKESAVVPKGVLIGYSYQDKKYL